MGCILQREQATSLLCSVCCTPAAGHAMMGERGTWFYQSFCVDRACVSRPVKPPLFNGTQLPAAEK